MSCQLQLLFLYSSIGSDYKPYGFSTAVRLICTLAFGPNCGCHPGHSEQETVLSPYFLEHLCIRQPLYDCQTWKSVGGGGTCQQGQRPHTMYQQGCSRCCLYLFYRCNKGHISTCCSQHPESMMLGMLAGTASWGECFLLLPTMAKPAEGHN